VFYFPLRRRDDLGFVFTVTHARFSHTESVRQFVCVSGISMVGGFREEACPSCGWLSGTRGDCTKLSGSKGKEEGPTTSGK